VVERHHGRRRRIRVRTCHGGLWRLRECEAACKGQGADEQKPGKEMKTSRPGKPAGNTPFQQHILTFLVLANPIQLPHYTSESDNDNVIEFIRTRTDLK
jgi:hypothetical protein